MQKQPKRQHAYLFVLINGALGLGLRGPPFCLWSMLVHVPTSPLPSFKSSHIPTPASCWGPPPGLGVGVSPVIERPGKGRGSVLPPLGPSQDMVALGPALTRWVETGNM